MIDTGLPDRILDQIKQVPGVLLGSVIAFQAKTSSVQLFSLANTGVAGARFDPIIQLENGQNAPANLSAYICFYPDTDPLQKPHYDPTTHRITIFQHVRSLQAHIDTLQKSKSVAVVYYESSAVPSPVGILIGYNF